MLRHSRRLVGAVKRRLFPGPAAVPQLEMIWPADRRVPHAPQAPEGFMLRSFRPGDEAPYQTLLERAGMGTCPLDYWRNHLLPGGFFVIDSPEPGRLAAACFASHHPAPRHPFGGNLGWLAADPAFTGRGLGRIATIAVVQRLVSAGYTRIYLTTDDHRLAAIRIYLQLGWVPLLFAPDMHGRWQSACAALQFPFTPESWPTT
ncbi:MAG TPA: GNAT family N-acetyltransferase [Vicinamibacterales bacterium]|nr:GNAT family N-acetyltransferase [Vicinamibacterales bacterium]